MEAERKDTKVLCRELIEKIDRAEKNLTKFEAALKRNKEIVHKAVEIVRSKGKRGGIK